MKHFPRLYVRLLQPWLCFAVYLWALEFQSVYDATHGSFLDSLADCGAILWCAALSVAVVFVPITIALIGLLRQPIVYANQWAVKIGLFVTTYFYFRRWLGRWIVTDFSNGLLFWLLAGSVAVLIFWSLFRFVRAIGSHRFDFPAFEDCFSFGVVPVLFACAIVLSVKVASHLVTNGASLMTVADVSASHGAVSQFRPNILLITADALREQSTALGSEEKMLPTPFLKTLAKRSSVFSNMHSNATSTSTAVTTILTGKHPFSHGNLTRKVSRYDSDENLLRVLRDGGYATAAITSNGEAANVVAALGQLWRPQFPDLSSKLLSWLRGLGVYPTVAGAAMYRDLFIIRGFVRSFVVDLPHGYANDTFHLADRILSEIPQPFFLFLHVNEPHVPYYALAPRALDNSSGEQLKIIREIPPDFAGAALAKQTKEPKLICEFGE